MIKKQFPGARTVAVASVKSKKTSPQITHQELDLSLLEDENLSDGMPMGYWESLERDQRDIHPSEEDIDIGFDENTSIAQKLEKGAQKVHSLIQGKTAPEVLQTVFGYSSFRGDQAEIVGEVVEGNNVLVLMPTGGGKSLCFQVPALVRQGVTVVISPLIALMQDQVERLKQLGVRAESLNSEMDQTEQRRIEREIEKGELDLIYVSPERLKSQGFQRLLDRSPIGLFAIDEAHCVSQWGHDFRPDYMLIGQTCDRFPHVPRMALTGTADVRTELDMIERLGLKNARIFRASFDRPNISYTCVHKSGVASKQLLEYLEPRKGSSGVVYCMTIKEVEETAEFLKKNGFDIIAYHAKMDSAIKRKNLKKFTHGEGIIAVATIAFGMGIDKPDVRFVVHNGLPSNLEAYYQETGRAGRDGLPAEGFLMYGDGDVRLRKIMLANNNFNSDEHQINQYHKFNAMMGYIESAGCRRRTVMNYFGEAHGGGCGNCDRCLRPVQTYDGTRDARIVLSAIKRTGERFGNGHLIDIITGSHSGSVVERKHDQLPTFGVGAHFIRDQWKHIMRQMEAMGFLYAPVDLRDNVPITRGYEITNSGMSVMRGEQTVELISPPLRANSSKNNRALPAAAKISEDLPEANQRLFEALKKWRMKTAKEQGVPPYVIMHDATFHSVAGSLPRSKEQLRLIPGIGASKIATYGGKILELVEENCPAAPAPSRIGVPGFR